jgi:hypothetical protein
MRDMKTKKGNIPYCILEDTNSNCGYLYIYIYIDIMHKQNHDHQAAPTVVGINSMILPGAEVLPAGHEHTHLMGPNRRMWESMA